MTRTQRKDRRAFLKAVGQAAMALPFYRALESSALAADQPLRFITFYYPHGISAPLYNRQAGETDTNYSLTFPDSVLSPFDDAATYGVSFKSKTTIIEGIDLTAGVEKNTNGHDASCIILTGCAPQGEKVANESLDQHLAVTKGLGSKTRLASLVLGVGNKDTQSGRNISYSKAGAPISKLIDPLDTYKLAFANLVVGDDPAAKLEAERRRLRGQSVLDSVRADVERLQTRLAGPEKVKLDQHLTALRELEKQLGGGAAGGATPTMGCTKPATPDKAKDFPRVEVYNGGQPYLDKICDLQMDLIAQAMACDITRFATLFFHLTEDIHNNVAHQYSARNRDSVLKLGKENRYYFAKGARLMKKLHDFGILDSTLVYITSDMGDPNAHSVRALPTVLGGGLNGKLKMGRRLVTKQSNSKLLVSIAQAFGVDTNSYGVASKPELTTGPLPELA